MLIYFLLDQEDKSKGSQMCNYVGERVLHLHYIIEARSNAHDDPHIQWTQ